MTDQSVDPKTVATHWKREIPNPQVFEAARDFHTGYLRLIAEPSGTILSALHCAAIALELYLKSLTAREVEIPGSYVPEVVTVYAESAQSHDLKHLFEQAPADFRDAIERKTATFPRLAKFPSFSHALGAHAHVFLASRYPYEPSSDISGLTIEVITALLSALREGIQSLPRRYELHNALPNGSEQPG